MFSTFSQFMYSLAEPFRLMASTYESFPLLVAFFLGLVGAFAPCQLTGNISALTLYGQRTIRSKTDWVDVGFFIFGKIVAFSLIGFLFWLGGRAAEEQLITLFPWLRKIIGPLIVVTGLVLLNVWRFSWITRLSSRVPDQFQGGKTGSFLMGIFFSIAFCPTMFVLFFVSLMPLVVTTSYGFVLPAVFGIATSFPVIMVLGAMWFVGVDRSLLKTSRYIGRLIQRGAGLLLVIIGLLDTWTYWA